MALSTSPRKVVPLAGGDDWQPISKPGPSGPSLTRRVFFCGVVVESAESGRRLPEGAQIRGSSCGSNTYAVLDVQDLIASLGDSMSADSDNNLLTSQDDLCLDNGSEMVSAVPEPPRILPCFHDAPAYNACVTAVRYVDPQGDMVPVR